MTALQTKQILEFLAARELARENEAMGMTILMDLAPAAAPAVGGRPSKYEAAYCNALVAFFESADCDSADSACNAINNQDSTTTNNMSEVRAACARLPTFERFARSIGTTTQTLRTWASRYPEFNFAYARAKGIQKDWLIQNGVTGLISPYAFIFLAKNITDMR